MTFLENIKETIKKIAQVLKTKADKTDIVQSDWAQTDVNHKAYIKNKPSQEAYSRTFKNLIKSVNEFDSHYWYVEGDGSVKEGNLYLPPNSLTKLRYKTSNIRIPAGIDAGTDFFFLIEVEAWKDVSVKFRDQEKTLTNDSWTNITLKGHVDLGFVTGGWVKGFEIEIRNNSNRNGYISFREIALYTWAVPTFLTEKVQNTTPKPPNMNPLDTLIQNIVYDLPQSYIFSTSDPNTPDYFTSFHYIMADGAKVTFEANSNMIAPEGITMTKKGAYAIFVKAKDKYILRINNPA